ncbi:MAG: hypothetical protein JO102_03505, partial [Elusimicrobia bacterium]|nr:hypothetical protein [Elusimicrobiota bacterium]
IFDSKGNFHAAKIKHKNFDGSHLDVGWDVKSITTDLAQLTGSAFLREGPGQAKNLGTLMDGSKAAKVLAAPLAVLQKIDKATKGGLKLAALEQLNFKSISADYTFTSGVAKAAPFVLDGDELAARMEGTVDFKPPQPLDMKATVTAQASQITGPLGQALAAVAGEKQTFKLAIKGTLDDPQMSVDKEALKEKAIDILRRQLGGGSSEPSQQSAPQSQDSGSNAQPAQKPEDQVKDLLRGLLKRR